MRQTTLSDTGFDKYSKKTRKERFLDDMDKIIPWKELSEAIEPFYPKPKGAGRRPIGIERMLRIHFLQHWFNLSDPAAEEALYDSLAMRRFVGIDLGREPAPDETTICKFRHLMERHNLGDRLFGLVNVYLAENGLKVNRGTIVDASIIDAPSSTKNRKKERDPEMHSTRKGRQWYFGMKAHIGVDSRSKLTERERSKNRTKSLVRAKVEHQFGIIKRQFGFTKVRYRGLAKNAHRLFVVCALSNRVMARRALLKRSRLKLQATCA
ncbi:IS5 family transposase [Candidatus Poribacteria bacterium]|nr:IS5 family transposase [Gammaproteobacteria bacterium]MYF97872.1 IS5 family transposase [Candidatus Poribacteria bacterium]